MKTYAYIDASNLFYGGEKSLGFKIDYKKLGQYVKLKYQAERILYFGGVEAHNYPFDYLKQDSIDIDHLKDHLLELLRGQKDNIDIPDAKTILLHRHLQRAKFFSKLKQFGYHLFLKPVKAYWDQVFEIKKRKANCDVDMTLRMMLDKDSFDRVLILSGDGDFLPVLKYLKKIGKEVLVLARGERTAREIRQFAGPNFRDFARLRAFVEFKEK